MVMTFSQLCMLLGNSVPSDQVLQCLGVMATLVRGCWVIKRYVTLVYSPYCHVLFIVTYCIRIVHVVISMVYHVSN